MPGIAEDYRQLLASLLPPGLIWPRDAESVLGRLLMALAEELARIDARAEDLINESDPRTTFELLSEWEVAYGLPDKCSGLSASLAERRAAVHSKLTKTGGQTPAFFVELALGLGSVITIEEFEPFTCGAGSRAGRSLGSMDVRYWWRVHGLDTPAVFLFHAGAWTAGNSIAALGTRDVECVLRELKPAQSELFFKYGE